MIIHDLHVVRMAISPNKTDPPLLIDADRMLSLPIAAQRLQLIARRRSKNPQVRCSVQLQQFSQRNPLKRTKALAMLIVKKRLSVLGAEALDHPQSVTRIALYVKRYTEPEFLNATAPL
jgi:hypothetical protein